MNQEELLHIDNNAICGGIDEAGRGALAGPVVASCVYLNRSDIQGITDSKVLTKKMRDQLYDEIMAKCYVGIGIRDHRFIDTYGIRRATHEAMKEALASVQCEVEHVLIDGRDNFPMPIHATYIIKGDLKEQCIGAASIIAKVTRDRIMEDYATVYPLYGFERHKGYGTRAHMHALTSHYPCDIHRTSYAPITRMLKVNRDRAPISLL